MFKKHSKRNFRKKIDHEDDETGDDREIENIPVISKPAVKNSKPKQKDESKIKTASSNSLLSFDDEGGDEGEVFKIRKSKESRRLAKKLEQERKKKEEFDKVGVVKKNDLNTDQGEDDTDERLAALRAELCQIAGDDDGEEAEDDTDSVASGPTKKEPAIISRSKTDFGIPDAATIHAARKRREMARQTEQDFIPLDDTQKYEGNFASTGRLVREDENDVSDDEGEEGPISFSVPKKRGFPALDRRREVEAALANQELEENSDNEEAEDDEEIKLWENEQIRKGVKGVSGPVVQPELLQTTEATSSLYQQQFTEENSLSYQTVQQPYTCGIGYNDTHTNGNQTYGPAFTTNSLQSRHAVTVDMICDKMKQQLGTLQEVHRQHRMDNEKASSQLETAQSNIKKLERQGRNAEQRFSFFQEMRGYVRDLIECLNNKVGDTSMLLPELQILVGYWKVAEPNLAFI